MGQSLTEQVRLMLQIVDWDESASDAEIMRAIDWEGLRKSYESKMNEKGDMMNKRTREKIEVFFETPNGGYAETAAIFMDDKTYMACLKALEELAKESRMVVTESVTEYDENGCEL